MDECLYLLLILKSNAVLRVVRVGQLLSIDIMRTPVLTLMSQETDFRGLSLSSMERFVAIKLKPERAQLQWKP